MYSQCFYVKVAITPDLQVEFRWTGKISAATSKLPNKNFKTSSCVTNFIFLILINLKSYEAEY